MRLNTRIFKLYKQEYRNLCELAQAMGISTYEVYWVKEGKLNIDDTFIVGATKAFPQHELSHLFYHSPESPVVDNSFQ